MAKRKPVIHKRDWASEAHPGRYWTKCWLSWCVSAKRSSRTWAGANCKNCLRMRPKKGK